MPRDTSRGLKRALTLFADTGGDGNCRITVSDWTTPAGGGTPDDREGSDVAFACPVSGHHDPIGGRHGPAR